MFNEELSANEVKAIKKKTKKERILNVLVIVLFFLSMASMFYCGYQISDLTFPHRNSDDYQYVKGIVDKAYNFNEYDKAFAEHSAINGYLNALGDDYAIYMSPEEYEKRQMSGKGESISLGLNIAVNDDGLVTVVGLVQNGNSINSGIEIGDILVSVNGNKTETVDEYNAFAMKNTFADGDNVEVVVRRNGEEKTFNIVTNKIVTPVCELTFMDDIAYIKLTTFSETSVASFVENLKKVNENSNCKGIILDLRNNGGGMVTSMQKIAGSFLSNDKLIATFQYKNYEEKIKPEKTSQTTDLPLVVLVNGNSASASECLTGALQYHKRATIIGTQTYGKGIGQSTYECPSGGFITITTLKYYLPDGTWIHETGVTPDILSDLPDDIKNGTTAITNENDTQLIAAKDFFKN